MDAAEGEAAAAVASLSDVSEANKHQCRSGVLELFPDIDPAHMNLLCDELRWIPAHVVQRILDNMEEGKSYPKLQRENLKRKRDDSEDVVSPQAVAKKWDNEARRAQLRDSRSSYIKTSHNILQKFFPLLYVENLKSFMALNGGILYPTFLLLSKATAAGDDDQPHMKKKKRLPPKGPPALASYLDVQIQSCTDDGDREAYEELRAALAVANLQKGDAEEKKRKEQEEEKNFEAATAEGTIAECGCCFDEFAINRMVHCDGVEIHFFCKDCARMMAETQIGMAKHKLDCMSTDGCTGGFAHSQRLIFLDEKSRMTLEQIEMDASIRESGIENIETCPFCSYAAEYPDIEVDREFRCLRDECRVVSCRACRKETHIPKTCEEAALEHGHSARHGIEEAMSAAMIRKCNKCAAPFIKDLGCNKMSCTKCGNIQCYVCSKSCDYSHFNDTRRGGKTGNCDLFDKEGGVEARHQEEVRIAEEEARKKVQEEYRDLDPEFLKFKESEKVKNDEARRRQSQGPGDRWGALNLDAVRVAQQRGVLAARNRAPHVAQAHQAHLLPHAVLYGAHHAFGAVPPAPQPDQNPQVRHAAQFRQAAQAQQARMQHLLQAQQTAQALRERSAALRALLAQRPAGDHRDMARQQAAMEAQLWMDPDQLWDVRAPLPIVQPASPVPEPRPLRNLVPPLYDFNQRHGQANSGGLLPDDRAPQYLQDVANENFNRGRGAAVPRARAASLEPGVVIDAVFPPLERDPPAAADRGDRAKPAHPVERRPENEPPQLHQRGGGRDDPIKLSPVKAAMMLDLTGDEIKLNGVRKARNMDENVFDWPLDYALEPYIQQLHDMEVYDEWDAFD